MSERPLKRDLPPHRLIATLFDVELISSPCPGVELHRVPIGCVTPGVNLKNVLILLNVYQGVLGKNLRKRKPNREGANYKRNFRCIHEPIFCSTRKPRCKECR